jgi:NAD(P)-dependent dehydrogenase (short-subunit alcohol dehydrogenase family)
MEFKDKVVLVAGGAGGIGEKIAHAFAREGSMTIILDSAEEGAQKVVREIESSGGKTFAVVVDATKEDEIKDAIDEIVVKLGRLDVLVNSIGWNKPMPFLETPESIWYRIIELNLMVTVRLCKAVLPYMIKQKFGRIVNISSQQGRRALPQAMPYAASKAAIISVTRSLAVGTAEHNIRVNAICPGTVDAGLTKQLMKNSPQFVEELLMLPAMRRVGQPEEIASVVVFLASEKSSFMTGQSLSVDGGTVML